MKRVFAILLLAVVAAGPALAGRAVDKSCDVPGPVRVQVEAMAGKIVVVGGGAAVRVQGTIGDGVEDVELECTDRKVQIQVRYPDREKNRDGEAELEITVPAGSDLRLEGLSTGQTVRGVTGDVVLETMSGDLVVAGSPSRVRASTLSGDVRIEGASGDVAVEAASGDITILGAGGTVHAETMSGRIQLEAEGLEDAELTTVSGSVTCLCSLGAGGRLAVEAVSGNVTLDLPDDIQAGFALETFNGTIVSTLGGSRREAARDGGYGPGRSLEFTLGSGDGTVEVAVFNGKCTLK